MHSARKLEEHEGLQIPVKAKPIKQWAIPEKIQAEEVERGHTFLKKNP